MDATTLQTVFSRSGKQRGLMTGGGYPCQLESCRGERIGVRWKSGKITFPCSKGLKERRDGALQIA